MPLYQSPAPYDDATKRALVDLLNPLTLDTLALALDAWRAHRSIRGPLFSSLHGLFQKLAEDLDGHSDKLAEMVAMLGGQPVGCAGEIADGSRLEAYPLDVTDGLAHCRELTARITMLGVHVQEGITATNNLGAADALDMLTQMQRGLGYFGWQIGSHVIAEDAPAVVEKT